VAGERESKDGGDDDERPAVGDSRSTADETQDGHRGDQGGENVPKLDQVEQVDIEATREGEALPKLDQVDQDIKATREGETSPKLDQVGTEDKEEASQIFNRCKRPIIKDKEEKRKNNERSKTEPERLATDRNKVQEPRDKRDGDNIQDGPKGDNQHKDSGSEHFNRTRLAKNAPGHATHTRDDYLLAEPRLAEAHDCSIEVPHAGADRSMQHNIPGTNPPQSQHLSKEGDGRYEGEGIGYDAGADHQANQHKEGGSEPFDKAQLTKIAAGHATPTGDNFPLADPRLVEAHDCSTVVQRTGADRSLQHNILVTNRPHSQHLSVEGDGNRKGEGTGYDFGVIGGDTGRGRQVPGRDNQNNV